MKFVLNGCSFCANYYLANELAIALGYAEFENLSIGGSSNRRIIRSTLEYVEQNSPGFVLLGLTFWNRQESPFLNATDPWVSYNAQGLQGLFAPEDAEFVDAIPRKEFDKYVQQRYVYDINQRYIDQLYCDIAMFSAYLKQKNIRHLIFNTCETDYQTYASTIDISKIKEVVPMLFVSNLHLANLGASFADQEQRWSPRARHYNGEEYRHLNDYLLQYINDRDI